jgi:hypothetical protein
VSAVALTLRHSWAILERWRSAHRPDARGSNVGRPRFDEISPVWSRCLGAQFGPYLVLIPHPGDIGFYSRVRSLGPSNQGQHLTARALGWTTCQIGILGSTAKDRENRRLPFDEDGRLGQILKRRAALGATAFVFGSAAGEYQPNIQTAWETLKLLANGFEPRRGEGGIAWNQERLREIDLRWHDLRHEGACRLLADGVDVRVIQLMLGHASLTQTQRYLNVTDEELRAGLEASWKMKKRRLRVVKKAS